MQSEIKHHSSYDFKEVIIEVSQNCNLSCIMCGFGQQKFEEKKFMSLDTFQDIIDQLAPYSQSIRLNGRGESTIHPDFVQMIEYISKHHPNCQINLFTNLSFLNDSLLDEFIRYNIQLFISIDSNVESELLSIRRGANFNLICSNLEKLKQASIRPFIVFTMQELNLHRIKDIGQFALECNCNIIYNTVRRDVGIESFIEQVTNIKERIKDDFHFIQKLFQEAGLFSYYPNQISGIPIDMNTSTKSHGEYDKCPVLGKELCVLYNGDVTPCNMFNPYVFGNLLKENLDQIFSGPRFKDFSENHKSFYYCHNCSCLSL